MDLEFKKLAVTKAEKIGIITFNRPDIFNTISFDTFRELEYALKVFESDDKIKIILLKANCAVSKSNTKIFSAGINLKEYEKKFQMIEENPAEFEKLLKQARSFLSKIETLKKPVIAGVDGLAVGVAFEIILACDLILVSDTAQFSFNEVNLGLIPGYGGSQRLIKAVGQKRTFEIVSSGRNIAAQEAMIAGFVAEICADSEFNKKSMEYCKKLAQKSSQSLWLTKDTINQINSKPIHEEIEVKNFIKAAGYSDAKEGITAFIEKRAPNFI